MSKSFGQEAFRVFENVLVAEIASENMALRENIDGLKECRRFMDEVLICIGDEAHVYSILEGEIGPDEPVKRCGLSDDILDLSNLAECTSSQRVVGEDTSLGTTIKFNLDRLEQPVFTLDVFKAQVLSLTDNTLIGPDLNGEELKSVASINYAGNSFSIENGLNVHRNKLDLKLNQDDSTIRFYFCQEKSTFQGVIYGVGPRDMERGMKGLANQIRATIEVNFGESHWSNFFYDSPNMNFRLESISIQFTEEIKRVHDLTQKLLATNESNELDSTSVDSNKKTESDALRSRVAVSLVNGGFVETLRENKQLRSELTSLSYMKSLLQTCHLKFGNESLIEMNLSRGFLFSDHLRSIGESELTSVQEDIFILQVPEEGLILDVNRLDKFSMILGANQFVPAGGILPSGRGMYVHFRVCSTGAGYADIHCSFDFGPLRQLDDDPELFNNAWNEIFNEDFRQKIALATRHGIEAGFPEWFKLKVLSISFPIDSVKMLLDI
ncbi:predicted protein [Chaetoceros tenuissimus]|uniref:Uncharacterized protein n=1 Tax=Chaetoceros tenuissimus TaxID=426638 RepID=A0AAD3D421_9STRA|nr:predicted protein [Chaetoceros tenuissimus]